MNDLQNKVSDSTEVSDLRAQCNALNRQLVLLMIAVLVVSGTLTVFLGVQARRLGIDVRNVRPQATQVHAAAEKETPMINAFMAQLVDYGKKHPDFAPIMKQFGLRDAPKSDAGTVSTGAPEMAAPAPKK